MDFHFSSSLLSPFIPLPPSWLTPLHPRQHPAPSLFSLALPCRWQREAILEGQGGRREEGREAWGKWSVGSGSSLSPCHSYDSRVIRLINEIIDHLMGLIINCFSTVSCPVSSPPPPSSCCHLCFPLFFIPVLSPLKDEPLWQSDLFCVTEGKKRLINP